MRAQVDRIRGEDGSVLIFVAIGLPVLIACLAIALDVGNWFVHRRALQNTVDAATFAGADEWSSCFDGSAVPGQAMRTVASEYGGGRWNLQIGGATKGQLQPLAFNSATFPPSNVPGYSDDTAADPCTPDSQGRYMFDVKATEDKLPLFLGGLLPSVTGPDIHATARAELRRIVSLNPSMPLAVPDVNPKTVSLTFVNVTGSNKGTTLTGCSGTGFVSGTDCTYSVPGPPAATAGIKTWSISGIKVKIPTGKSDVQMRVGLGATAGDCPFGSTGGAGYACIDSTDYPVENTDFTEGGSSVSLSSLSAGVHTLDVSVALAGNFKVYKPCSIADGGSGGSYSCPAGTYSESPAGDPTLVLRFASTSGSRTYAVDCGTIPGNTGGQFYQQIRYGCANSFSIDSADLCPDPADPTPTDCAPIASIGSGDKLGQIRQAMTDRLAPDGVCAPNNYPDTSITGDKRIVTLIVTDFSAFWGSGGSASVPVVTYGAFYVTGWDGAPGGCDNEPYPGPGAKQSGDVWGHFITYTTFGNGGPQACQVGALAPCTPVLVK